MSHYLLSQDTYQNVPGELSANMDGRASELISDFFQTYDSPQEIMLGYLDENGLNLFV